MGLLTATAGGSRTMDPVVRVAGRRRRPVPMFSTRLPVNLDPNPLARALSQLRGQAVPLVDLTASNPTTAGLAYPEGLLECLQDPRSLVYEPRPLGLTEAREAVAVDYARRGVMVAADRIVMTASSSESYSLLFKLLCDPGDSVLVPVPSYPLFEHLASLDGVRVRPYRLELHDRWTLPLDEIARAVDTRTRAVLVVSPNNPTGSMLTRGETRELHALCARHDLALIGDEVFCDYTLEPGPHAGPSVLDERNALTVSLGGLSKSIGLPQLKLGWMAFAGPDGLVEAALHRLEIIADTYLSVGTPVQVAAARLLERGACVRRQIADRVLLNYGVQRTLAGRYPWCRVLPAEGGWSAVVQVPAIGPDEERAIALARQNGVLVHPGYFFDFDRDGFFVVSLLVPPDDFRAGVSRMLEIFDGTDDR
jgi:aspartate/methionine/tyrosine aminotransferase